MISALLQSVYCAPQLPIQTIGKLKLPVIASAVLILLVSASALQESNYVKSAKITFFVGGAIGLIWLFKKHYPDCKTIAIDNQILISEKSTTPTKKRSASTGSSEQSPGSIIDHAEENDGDLNPEIVRAQKDAAEALLIVMNQ